MVMFDAESIRRLRLTLSMTLAEFGRLVGVSESTVCCWETNRNHPSFKAGLLLNEVAAELASGKRKPMASPAPVHREPVRRGPRTPKSTNPA